MSSTLFLVGGGLFALPLILLSVLAVITGGYVPDPVLTLGGFIMAIGVIVGAVGGFLRMNEG